MLSLQVLSLKHGKSLFRWGGAGAPSQCSGKGFSLYLLTCLSRKRVEDPCIYWMNPGPWYLPNDSFWSLDPPVLLLILVAVLVAAIGKGQSTNRHPRAIHRVNSEKTGKKMKCRKNGKNIGKGDITST